MTGGQVTSAVANATTAANFSGTVLGSQVVSTVDNAISALFVPGSGVSGSVANANAVPGSGITGSIAASKISGTVGSASFATTAGSANSVSGSNVSGAVANAATAVNSFRLGNITANSWGRTFFGNSGTAFPSSGSIGIKTTGALVSSVKTSGSGNNISIFSVSDRRLKTDIRDETLGLSFVNTLRPVRFRMKADTKSLAHGFIAQEVAELITDEDGLVMQNVDGSLGFDYNGITAVMTKAIQELSDEVSELKKRLDKYES